MSLRKKISKSMQRAEKRVLIAWIRFARVHRHSKRLIVILFTLLYLDAFVMVIPSMLITAVAVTISPKRWWIFALTFVIATACNNYTTYWIGRLIPDKQILEIVHMVGIQDLWASAENAIRQYGRFANLPGGLFGLPTQLVTMIIGIADSQAMYGKTGIQASIEPALIFGAIGHGIKIFVTCGLVRFGWLKLEKKFDREGRAFLNRKSR